VSARRPRKLRSPLALIVLGLLAEQPLHPYAMRQRISERAHDRLPGVRLASLYDVVHRLTDAGLVSPGESSRQEGRPERVSYVITGAGREALTGWVAQSLEDPASAEEFPVAVSFMYVLGPDRVGETLRARAHALSESITVDEAALAGAERGGVAPIFLSEHRYQLALRRAERDWVLAFTEAIRTGALKFPDAQEGT
jgi:DNA-binding PadR family transcriptional regulator